MANGPRKFADKGPQIRIRKETLVQNGAYVLYVYCKALRNNSPLAGEFTVQVFDKQDSKILDQPGEAVFTFRNFQLQNTTGSLQVNFKGDDGAEAQLQEAMQLTQPTNMITFGKPGVETFTDESGDTKLRFSLITHRTNGSPAVGLRMQIGQRSFPLQECVLDGRGFTSVILGPVIPGHKYDVIVKTAELGESSFLIHCGAPINPNLEFDIREQPGEEYFELQVVVRNKLQVIPGAGIAVNLQVGDTFKNGVTDANGCVRFEKLPYDKKKKLTKYVVAVAGCALRRDNILSKNANIKPHRSLLSMVGENLVRVFSPDSWRMLRQPRSEQQENEEVEGV